MRSIAEIRLPQISKTQSYNKCPKPEVQTEINNKLMSSDSSFAIRSSALAGISFKSNIKAAYVEDKLMQILDIGKSIKVPVILDFDQKSISRIAKDVANNPEQRRALLISGMSGAGKSTLIDHATRQLRNDKIITIIQGDNFYHDISKELKEAGSFDALLAKGKNLDIPGAVNLEQMAKTIKKLVNGEENIKIPYYDFITGGVTQDHILLPSIEKGGIVIGDSIFALGPELKHVRDIGMYVHCPEDVITQRWYDRAASRGRTGKDADSLYETVMKSANTHIKAYKDNADIVVNGQANINDSADIISQFFKVIASVK